MQTLLQHLTSRLSEVYPSGEAASVAKILLSEGFGWGTLLLYTGKDSDLSEAEQQKLHIFMERLCANEPIQYVTGRALFCGNEFEVSPAVLIPRPETEELVYEIATDWKGSPSPSLLDMGTGSGCIAISLSFQMPEATAEAWDISEEALSVARKNASRLGAKVNYKQVDLLSEAALLSCAPSSLDIIVSNPPYIRDSEKEMMEPNVLEWEPELALFVPDTDPLLYYRSICRIGQRLLRSGGMLYFEINAQFGTELSVLMQDMGYHSIRLKQDSFGKDRIIKGIR